MNRNRLIAGSRSRDRTTAVVVAVVTVHVVLTVGHGLAHLTIPVPIPDWQGAFAAFVLFAGPVAGAVLVARGRERIGLWLMLGAGLAALAFEGAFHFVLAGPDNVESVAHGHATFLSTATLSTVSDAVLVLAGGWALRRQTHGSSSNAGIESTT